MDVVPESKIKLTLRVTDVASGGSIAYTTLGGILEALADAGVLEVDRHRVSAERTLVMYCTPWKEAK